MLPASKMLLRMGITMSSDKTGAVSIPSRIHTTLRSIFSRTVDPRRGSNPSPVILVHPVIFSILRLLTASTHVRMDCISSSVNFDAKLFSISPKSTVSHVCDATMVSLLLVVLLRDVGIIAEAKMDILGK